MQLSFSLPVRPSVCRHVCLVLVFPLSVILSVLSIVRSSVHQPGNICLLICLTVLRPVICLLISSVCRHIGRIVFPPSAILTVSSIFCSSVLLSNQSICLYQCFARPSVVPSVLTYIVRPSSVRPSFCSCMVFTFNNSINEYMIA